MSRKPIVKDLPPLEEAFGDFRALETGCSRQIGLTNLLKDCAARLQSEKPRPFYTMREIALYFSVPLRTAALAYEALDLAGFLHRLRGSQTMLAGKKITSNQPVNAVVGLPIGLQAMITSPFECNLQMEIEEMLRMKGFVADSIFYRSNEEYEPDFTERLIRHRLDIVIWLSPHPLSTHVLMSLRERGVRLILLQSAESPLRVPARSHILEWKEAYMEMARQWKKQNIRYVTVPTPDNLVSRRALKQLKPILEAEGLELEEIEPNVSALIRYIADSKIHSSVFAFIDFQNADALCNGYPELIEKISESSPLAFCRGPVRIPRLTAKRICVDVVELDPVSVARAVVDDLCDPHHSSEKVLQSIYAQYHSQVIMNGANELSRPHRVV